MSEYYVPPEGTLILTLVDIWKTIPKDVPVFCDYHMYDIPETMKKGIYNAPDNVIAMSFGIDAMPPRWQKLVARWCDTNVIKPVWWSYPKDGN